MFDMRQEVELIAKECNVSIAIVLNTYTEMRMHNGMDHENALKSTREIITKQNHAKKEKELEKRIQDAMQAPLYVKARKAYEYTQKQQIEKGMRKYPEPLNPESWTIDELVQHAMDELVDLSHYLQALKEKGVKSIGAPVPAKETPQVDLLYRDIDILRNENNEIREENKKMAKEWHEMKNALEKERQRVNKLTLTIECIKQQVLE